MATPTGERKRLVNKAIRQLRALYRQADTQGEKVERELDRLIKRKTQVEIKSLDTLIKTTNEYYNKVQTFARGYSALAQAIRVGL